MPHESFWDFSCRVYRRPEVSSTCLHLQDQYGLDVNLLLFCCWHGVHYGALDAATAHQARALSEQWSREVVQALRSARRWMKTQIEASSSACALTTLREKIKTLELECEKYQQDALQTLPRHPAGKLSEAQCLDAVVASLKTLIAALDRPMSPALHEDISRLILASIAHDSLTKSERGASLHALTDES